MDTDDAYWPADDETGAAGDTMLGRKVEEAVRSRLPFGSVLNLERVIRQLEADAGRSARGPVRPREEAEMIQVVSVVGAALILAAYAANQLGRVRAATFSYSLVNAVGAGVLTFVAAVESQWGFLFLEGAWTLISLYAIWRLLARGSVHARG